VTIHQQVDDAAFLAQNGRYLGALTVLMLAVAASARKAFPKGMKSIERPDREMSDRETFTLFLGGRIRKLLFGDFGGPDSGTSGISVEFKGAPYDIAFILYKFYRCELVHEGGLPEDVEFAASSPFDEGAQTGKNLSVSISSGNRMVLDYGWIDVLRESVIRARCNGAEFGIQHFDLLAKDDVVETVLENALVAKYDITEGRVRILKQVIRLVSPDSICSTDDAVLNAKFLQLLQSGAISGGALTALASRGLADWSGALSPKGLTAIREMAASYKMVPV
jgi:hypothetical protein